MCVVFEIIKYVPHSSASTFYSVTSSSTLLLCGVRVWVCDYWEPDFYQLMYFLIQASCCKMSLRRDTHTHARTISPAYRSMAPLSLFKPTDQNRELIWSFRFPPQAFIHHVYIHKYTLSHVHLIFNACGWPVRSPHGRYKNVLWLWWFAASDKPALLYCNLNYFCLI